MNLVIWSPIALFAEALGVLLRRELDVEGVTTIGVTDQQSFVTTLHDTHVVVVIGVPLEECRQRFGLLDLDTQSSLVAVYLAESPQPLFVSRAKLFGFADVIDLSDPTSSVIESLRDVMRSGPSIGLQGTWTLEAKAPLETIFCPHCRDERDVQILRLIVDGYTDSRIADELALNSQTVRNRVSNMLLESGMANRTQLAIDFYRTQLALRGVSLPSTR